MKEDYKCAAYIGDPPNQVMGFVEDSIDVSYFVKALETRLKYCPDQAVNIIISAESTRRILKALKDAEHNRKKAERMMDCLQSVLSEIEEERRETE